MSRERIKRIELTKNIKAILECAVCLGIPYADTVIRNCINAHVLCSTCLPSLKEEECPVCRQRSIKYRNRIAEKIIIELNFEQEYDFCRYCVRPDTRENLKKHEVICNERQICCPLSIINGLVPRRCDKMKSQNVVEMQNHFRFCCPDKLYESVRPDVFSDYYSHFLINTVIESDQTIRFATRHYTLFFEELFVFRPIRLVNRFFDFFMGHTYFYRCNRENVLTHYFGVCLSLSEELCNKIKIEISLSKNEHFAPPIVQRNVTPVSHSFRGINLFQNPNFIALTQNDIYRLTSFHSFFYFKIEILSYGNLPTLYPDLFAP